MCQRTPPGKLFKKQEKRYRSEERWLPKPYAANARAKSEERVKESKKDIRFESYIELLSLGYLFADRWYFSRPLARSTDVSMERLRTSHSSAGSDDEDWFGIYAESFLSNSWIYVSDADETLPWHRSDEEGISFDLFHYPPIRPTDSFRIWVYWIYFITEEKSGNKFMQNYLLKQKTLSDITDSESEFHYKYETVINNIIHRKMSTELQKYLASNSFSKSIGFN